MMVICDRLAQTRGELPEIEERLADMGVVKSQQACSTMNSGSPLSRLRSTAARASSGTCMYMIGRPISCSRPATKYRSTFCSRRRVAMARAVTPQATLCRQNDSIVTRLSGMPPNRRITEVASARSCSWAVPTMLMAWLTVSILDGKPYMALFTSLSRRAVSPGSSAMTRPISAAELRESLTTSDSRK